MANLRLYGPNVRIGLASVYAFADWQNPTVAEFNARSSTNPHAQVFELSCALDEDSTTFDLGESETDDSKSFCQVAGTSSPTSYNPEIVFSAFQSEVPWVVSDPATLNTANLAKSLLAWRGVEYFAWMSVGKEPGALFTSGDRVKLARVATDFGIDEIGSGDNAKLNQTFASRGDVNWNFELL